MTGRSVVRKRAFSFAVHVFLMRILLGINDCYRLFRLSDFDHRRPMKTTSMLYCIGLTFLITFIFCEFFIYYIVLAKCSWPSDGAKNEGSTHLGASTPVRAMLLADTHLLGPFRGHWWDKLRREWQMHRSFQTAVHLFHPECIFFLGDLFDEGQWVDRTGFREYVERFSKLFHTPEGIKVISLVGNHDVGFHYRLHPIVLERFNEAFNKSAINLHSIRGVHFATINSMVMENDGCHFCESALKELNAVKSLLDCSRNNSLCKSSGGRMLLQDYSRPVLLQHFPTYRISDENCLDGDIPFLENYRENWEVLSKESTDKLGNALRPRVVFSGHSHHYCRIINRLQIEEYTLSSFSWRNKNNPSFLLATFTPTSHLVSICYLPQESTVISIYSSAVFVNVLIILFFISKRLKWKRE